ncbi:hypothetical protein F441_06093, partial [Phytophthora nicotianae CJ01A1]
LGDRASTCLRIENLKSNLTELSISGDKLLHQAPRITNTKKSKTISTNSSLRSGELQPGLVRRQSI